MYGNPTWVELTFCLFKGEKASVPNTEDPQKYPAQITGGSDPASVKVWVKKQDEKCVVEVSAFETNGF